MERFNIKGASFDMRKDLGSTITAAQCFWDLLKLEICIMHSRAGMTIL